MSSLLYNGEARTSFTARNKTTRELSTLRSGLTSVQRAAAALGVTFGALSAAAAVRELVEINAEYQKLNASLITVTGSQVAANNVMANLIEFSKQTPFQISEITESYIKMKALGLDPTEEALTSFGNTSAAMGKDLNQMIEAVADASTGEFERLKEFGIKSKSQGENVTFIFQGVSTTVRKEASEIQAYLQSIGREKFGDAMALQMGTIGGAISNLNGEWDTLINKIGDSGANDTVVWSITAATNALRDMGDAIDELSDRESAFQQTVSWLNTGSNQIIDFIRQGLGGGNRGDFTPEQLENLHNGIDISNMTIGLGVGDNIQTAIDRRALELALQQNTFNKTGYVPEAVGYLGDAWLSRDIGMIGANARTDTSAEELRKLQEVNAQKYQIEIEQGQMMRDLWMTRADEKYEIISRGLDAEIQAEEAARQQKEQIWSSSLSTFTNLTNALYVMGNKGSRRMFELNKIAGIAEATISTYRGAAKALELGWPMGPIAAAAITAQGLAQVASIQSQTFSGGSSSYSTAAGGASPVVTTPDASGADTQQEQQLTIILKGAVTDAYVEEDLIPMINEAGKRNVKIVYET